jgi:hypothetical protein
MLAIVTTYILLTFYFVYVHLNFEALKCEIYNLNITKHMLNTKLDKQVKILNSNINELNAKFDHDIKNSIMPLINEIDISNNVEFNKIADNTKIIMETINKIEQENYCALDAITASEPKKKDISSKYFQLITGHKLDNDSILKKKATNKCL